MASTLRHPESSAAHLVRYSLGLGHKISVFDGEVWSVRYSTDEKEILDAIDEVDESEIKIFDDHLNPFGWAFIVLGNAPDEDVNDCSAKATFYPSPKPIGAPGRLAGS